MKTRVISLVLFGWLILPAITHAAIFGYKVGADIDAQARNACYSYTTLQNKWVCRLTVRTSKVIVSGTNNAGTVVSIGFYDSINPAGQIQHTFHFGHASNTVNNNPAPECPPNGGSTYNATTGLCSPYTANPNFCLPFPAGVTNGQGMAFETFVSGFGCSWDQDHDNILMHLDNCPDVLNPDQADGDNDGVGDMCDVCPPGVATVTYAVMGHTVRSDIPNSLCDGNKCSHQLNISQCSNGNCNISFNSNGQSCPATIPFDLSQYVLQAPSTYGFDVNADNQAFSISYGFQNLVGLNTNQRFMITNCLEGQPQGYLPSETPVMATADNWTINPSACDNFIGLNECKTPVELDNMVQQYIRDNPFNRAATPIGVSNGPQVPGNITYRYYQNGVIRHGNGTLFDHSLGSDSGNGTYEAYLEASSNYKVFRGTSGSPTFDPGGVPQTGKRPLKFSLKGCTGGTPPTGGGGSGGTVSGEVSVTELKGNHADISNGVNTSRDSTLQKFDDVITDANELGADFTTAISQSNIVTNAPAFFQDFQNIFSPSSGGSCPQLTINTPFFSSSSSFNLLSQFCTKWDEFGRPVLSFIVYWLTLIAIRNIWLDSSPKPN